MHKLMLFIGVILCCNNPNSLSAKKNPSPPTPPSESWLGIMVHKDKSVIMRVLPNSPAAELGLQTGDEVISFNNKPVTTAQDIKKVLDKQRPGTELRLKIRRGKELYSEKITVGKKQPHVIFPWYHTRRWAGPIDPDYDAVGGRGISPIVFYFTATWCPPCKEIAHDIEKLYLEYKDKITFIAVASDDDFFKVIELQRAGHYSFTVMQDVDLKEMLKIDTLPTFVIVTLDGDITTRYEGVDTNDTETNTLKLIKKEIDFILTHNYTDCTLL